MNYTRWPVALILLTALVSAQGWAQAPAAAVLAVQGDIPSPLSLTADDLAKMPRESVSVPAPDGSKIVYEGVTLLEILQKAGAPSGKQLRGKALASYVLAKAQDGYQVTFTLGEIDPQFGNQSILLADKRDGKPLPDKQGPFRLVCPNDKEGARSVRMLETLEVVRLAK
ncbi:MAG: molybdopterin-dependent oxidoreductase [Bryobacterales bacterium]|nr:molybdopterin-dependent oxidoreductase [Bryobacterales bacterium]